MYRDFLINKWVVSGIAFLVLFSLSCYLWYEYETTPYKQEAIKTAEIARQWKTEKALTDNLVETTLPYEPVDSRVSTTDKLLTQTVEVKTNIETDTDNAKHVPLKAEENDKPQQRVSKFGLGPFPPLPPDYPRQRWVNYSSVKFELMDRVQLKLWEQGIRDIRGMGYDNLNGLIYLNRPGVVYVEYEYTETEDEINRSLSVCGNPISEEDVEILRKGGTIPGLTVLKMSDGIEPYSFLGLTK